MLIPFIFEVMTLFVHISPSSSQSTCGPKVSARLLMDIPCDMSKTNFCELSGTIYPWAAVRRYIYENQGLLRRMYGDQRHYQILTNEIQDLKEKYDNVFIYDKETKFYDSNHIYQHQSPYTKYQPQFRPRSFFMEETNEDEPKGTTNNDAKRMDVNNTGNDTSDGNGAQVPFINNNQTKMGENVRINDRELVHNETSYNQAFPLKETHDEDENPESTTIQTTETSESALASSNVQNSPSDTEYAESVTVTTTQDYNNPPSSTESTDPEITILEKFYLMGTNNNNQETPDSSTSSSSTTVTSSFTKTSSPSPSTMSLNEGAKGSPMNTHSTPPSVTDSSHGDESGPSPATIDPDQQPKSKGVNACPVREEVIAPYWANNTRGEILALLNVYPFEQYVHWEKCAHENSQMFCRDGCRCEQQYRLHRLLAFDPKNECRGIFADWFRFPSCCVCICYDLPESNIFYRSTKRKSRL